MQRAGESFTMGYSITNTTWDNNKKWAYLALPDPKNSTSSEILPQGQFYNFKPIKGMTYTQSILIDTDATYNPNGQPKNSWFTLQGHNHIRGCFEQLSETTYRFWSTYTWQLEDIALRAFDWTGLETVLDFRNSGTYIAFYKPKLEAGERPSDWNLAPEDYGWSATTLVPTQTQRYLWKFEYIYYSDGSVKVTQPVNISIAGADGTNGQTSHIHFAFADDATGGGFSLTTPKAYMGWYADFNESASNDPTKYKWSKWKGDEGAPGKPGADGKTSYFHMAYADSADGKTGFSFTESGQQYQGYYTDFTQASSTDPTKYTWMDRRAGVEVSARNLWIQSKATGGFVEETLPDNHITGQNKCYRIPNNTELSFNIEPDFSSRLYRKVTFSAWVKYENVVQGANSWNVFNCFKHTLYCKNSSTGATSTANYLTLAGFAGTSDWKYITYTYDYAANKLYDQLKTNIRFNIESAKSGTAWVTGVMVQFGNVATGHVWSPEDIQANIDNKADQSLTQDQLNALAEKNRNMEAEMSAKASLAEIEQWKQAYDSYVAQNDADKTEAEQKLIMLTSRVAEWVKDWEDKKVQWSFLDTNMDFGEEGLRLGKKGSPTSILISNDRIGFYSGGSEVASMSNGTLTIDNGIFAKSLQIGHYREEVYEGDKTINVIRWVD
ncbi:hypothetical protein Si070_01674 [Streptococcus infantarius subsp. infantarius]|nr:hypothetical protein [Streptococcus infantarius subsp. infantarius]